MSHKLLVAFGLILLSLTGCGQSGTTNAPAALPLAVGQPTLVFFYTDN